MLELGAALVDDIFSNLPDCFGELGMVGMEEVPLVGFLPRYGIFALWKVTGL